MKDGRVAVTLGQKTATEIAIGAKGGTEAGDVILCEALVLGLVRQDVSASASVADQGSRRDARGAAPEFEEIERVPERDVEVVAKVAAKGVGQDLGPIAQGQRPSAQHAVAQDVVTAAVAIAPATEPQPAISAPSFATSETPHAPLSFATNETRRAVNEKDLALPPARFQTVMNRLVAVIGLVHLVVVMGRIGNVDSGR